MSTIVFHAFSSFVPHDTADEPTQDAQISDLLDLLLELEAKLTVMQGVIAALGTTSDPGIAAKQVS